MDLVSEMIIQMLLNDSAPIVAELKIPAGKRYLLGKEFIRQDKDDTIKLE